MYEYFTYILSVLYNAFIQALGTFRHLAQKQTNLCGSIYFLCIFLNLSFNMFLYIHLETIFFYLFHYFWYHFYFDPLPFAVDFICVLLGYLLLNLYFSRFYFIEILYTCTSTVGNVYQTAQEI